LEPKRKSLMKAHLKAFTCLMSVLLVTAVLAINGQKVSKSPDEPDVNQFPILDYKKSVENKERKGKKYNSPYAPKISESSDGIFTISDWEMGLSALPVNKSAAVVVGEVTAAQALLSDDETNIYSEFTVQITEIPKNDKNFSLGIGNSVIVERLGGRVRLPSGKVVVSRTDKQDLPRIGNRYVLFLTRDINKDGSYEDFHILTGYELRNGKVFPLDKLRPGHPITAYTATDASSFFTDLNRVLASSSTSQSR